MSLIRVVGVGLGIMACLCHGVAVGRAAADEMIVEEMTLTGRASVPLDHAAVTITQREGDRVAVPIAMSKSTYRATVRTVIDGVTKDWSGELSCFEASSTDGAVPFVWVLCTSWPIDHVFVLTEQKSRDSYFALAYGVGVSLFPIARPRDQTEAMTDFFLLRDWNAGLHVPVTDMLGFAPFRSSDATHLGGDITVISVAHDQGTWAVKVRGPLSDEVFTLVSPNGKDWHLQQPPE